MCREAAVELGDELRYVVHRHGYGRFVIRAIAFIASHTQPLAVRDVACADPEWRGRCAATFDHLDADAIAKVEGEGDGV